MKQNLFLLFSFIFFLPTIFAATIFEDNFNDGNINGWTGYGTAPSQWQANSNLLKYNGGSYVGSISFAAIDSLLTPTNFTMEADFMITSSDSYGHIGFFWGYQSTNTFNTAYVRTHSDHITHWSYVNGSQSAESYLYATANNGVWYHMKISVDYTTKTMITQFGSTTQTFTGSTFDSINRNSGGKMGVLTWGEVGYFDNIVVTSTVPEASTIATFCMSLLLFIAYKMKKNL
ncbi:MAG: hypothetical protein HUU50_12240 [Candidatus Brocadiae bacterium]|nr:hypothetical protein [Candidatus Brocadiia bacterium]